MLDSRNDSEKTTDPRLLPPHWRFGMSHTTIEALERSYHSPLDNSHSTIQRSAEDVTNISYSTYSFHKKATVLITERYNSRKRRKNDTDHKTNM